MKTKKASAGTPAGIVQRLQDNKRRLLEGVTAEKS